MTAALPSSQSVLRISIALRRHIEDSGSHTFNPCTKTADQPPDLDSRKRFFARMLPGKTFASTRTAPKPQGFHTTLPRTVHSSSYHHRIGMGPSGRTQDVVGRLYIGDPVANGLAGSVLQCCCATVYRPHLSAAQAHAKHVERLSLHVLCTHVYNALQSQARTDSSLQAKG